MAKRRKTIQRDPFGREVSTYEEEEEDGVLQDGHSLRAPLYLMDGKPNPQLDPTQRAVAKEARTGKLLVSDGTDHALNLHKPGFRYSTDAGERTAADAALTEAYEARELADREAWRSNDMGDHPLISKIRGTVPGKQEGGRCSIDGKPGRLQMVNGKLECIADGRQDAVEDAYREYDRQQSEAWRS